MGIRAAAVGRVLSPDSMPLPPQPKRDAAPKGQPELHLVH
jgi:hypothetical protein